MITPFYGSIGPLGRQYRQFGAAVDPRWDNLVAGWKLDEVSDGSAPVARADVLGNYELTDNNTVASTTGLIGNAGAFVNADVTSLSRATDAFAITAGGSLRFISAWIKPTAFGVGNRQFLSTNNSKEGGWVMYHSDTGLPVIILNRDGGSTSIVGDAACTAGVWNFVAAWFNPTDSKLYLQLDGGAPKASAAITLDAVNTTNIFAIGSISLNFDGAIDETYLFSAGSDVLADDLYNTGAGRSYPN